MSFQEKDIVRIIKKNNKHLNIIDGTIHQIIKKNNNRYTLSNYPYLIEEEYLEPFIVNPEAKAFAIDFDGTLCQVQYPNIGSPIEYNISKIKQLKEKGHYLLLWTCREGSLLDDAILWCQEFGLYFDTHNYNLPHRVQAYFDCRKLGADIYIDDLALHPAFLKDLIL